MKNLMKLFGIIALTAIIGFSMTACGDDDDDDSGNITVPGLTSGAPTTAMLTNVGISNTTYNGMSDSARSVARALADDSNYSGYVYGEDEYGYYLSFYWTNKTIAKYNALVAFLTTDLGLEFEGYDDDGDGILTSFGDDTVNGKTYIVFFHKKDWADSGWFFPENALGIDFVKNN